MTRPERARTSPPGVKGRLVFSEELVAGISLGLAIGMSIGFVLGILFSLYILPFLAHFLAGHVRDRA